VRKHFAMKFFLIKSALLLLLLIAFAEIKAQDKPFFVGFRYGFSLPMGQFASHEYKKDTSLYGGYAMLATSFSGEGAWYFSKRFGVGANFSASYYPIATGWFLQDKLNDEKTASYLDVKSGPFTVRTLMTGAYYRLPVMKHFSLSFKAMGGVNWTSTPDQFFGGNYYLAGMRYFRITSAKSRQFAVLTGASFNYQLFDHVQLLLESEFSYTESKFHFIKGINRVTNYMKMPLFKVQPGLNITF